MTHRAAVQLAHRFEEAASRARDARATFSNGGHSADARRERSRGREITRPRSVSEPRARGRLSRCAPRSRSPRARSRARVVPFVSFSFLVRGGGGFRAFDRRRVVAPDPRAPSSGLRLGRGAARRVAVYPAIRDPPPPPPLASRARDAPGPSPAPRSATTRVLLTRRAPSPGVRSRPPPSRR